MAKRKRSKKVKQVDELATRLNVIVGNVFDMLIRHRRLVAAAEHVLESPVTVIGARGGKNPNNYWVSVEAMDELRAALEEQRLATSPPTHKPCRSGPLHR